MGKSTAIAPLRCCLSFEGCNGSGWLEVATRYCHCLAGAVLRVVDDRTGTRETRNALVRIPVVECAYCNGTRCNVGWRDVARANSPGEAPALPESCPGCGGYVYHAGGFCRTCCAPARGA